MYFCQLIVQFNSRSASSALKQHAKGIQDKFGDSSALDAIKVHVHIYLSELKDGKNIKIGCEKEDGDKDNRQTFGSITVTFLYDSDICWHLPSEPLIQSQKLGN